MRPPNPVSKKRTISFVLHPGDEAPAEPHSISMPRFSCCLTLRLPADGKADAFIKAENKPEPIQNRENYPINQAGKNVSEKSLAGYLQNE